MVKHQRQPGEIWVKAPRRSDSSPLWTVYCHLVNSCDYEEVDVPFLRFLRFGQRWKAEVVDGSVGGINIWRRVWDVAYVEDAGISRLLQEFPLRFLDTAQTLREALAAQRQANDLQLVGCQS